jgi:hypothetical protein
VIAYILAYCLPMAVFYSGEIKIANSLHPQLPNDLNDAKSGKLLVNHLRTQFANRVLRQLISDIS